MSTTIRGILGAAAVALASGCGSDASAPVLTSPAGSALARHIDSLVTAGRANPLDSIWAATLLGAEVVPANGAAATSLLVTTHGATHTWQGFVLVDLSQAPDTTYVLWAYSDDAFTEVLQAPLGIVPGHPVGTEAFLIVNDSLVAPTLPAMSASITSVGGDCTFTFGLQNYSTPPHPGACSLGTFSVQLNGSFVTLDTLAIGPQPLSGVLLQ